MRKISNESIPITSIFLSGRPLAVNNQINLSSAFIAAWLPGQAVEGIADVILQKDGKINKDFTGKDIAKQRGSKIVYNGRDHSFSSTSLRKRVASAEYN